MVDFIVNWLAFTPEFALPLLLAAVGLILNERAGVLNLGAEGIMLCGALASVACYLEFSGSLWVATSASLVAGALVSALFAFLVVLLRANQVVVGITFVFFGSGLTGLVGVRWTDKAVGGFKDLDLGALSELPIVGPILFRQDAMVYVTVLIVVAVWFFLHRTVMGMNLRAAGESPEAADAAGHSVAAYRFWAVVAGGALVGLAGGYLAMATAKIWVEEMINGRGWIAIALVIFARWQPSRAVVGALLFGGIEALIPRVMATGAPVPQYFLLSTPYLATLIVLIFAATLGGGRMAAPLSLGEPFTREDRR
jgi:simple sugar transport system permease protein